MRTRAILLLYQPTKRAEFASRPRDLYHELRTSWIGIVLVTLNAGNFVEREYVHSLSTYLTLTGCEQNN